MNFKRTSYALAGVLAVSLTGCGGGDDNGTPAATATPAPTASPAPNASACDESFVSCSGDNATISGVVNKSLELSSNLNWFLDGYVYIGEGSVEIADEATATAIRNNGVTLTIPAGTHVRGNEGAALIVARGSKIEANGTRTQPITFSSAIDDNLDGAGEWGGVVIQGFAPQFGVGGTGPCHGGTRSYCNVVGEGNAGFYGGNAPADDSGTLRYVRIAEGGLSTSANSEVNGLTLQGVGHATTVEYIQVHNNQDDAVEWFGGTVNAKYLVLTGNDDDDVDFDQGWKGNVQYVLAIKANGARVNSGNDPRGIEANSSDEEFVLETEGALANVTLIGGEVSNLAGDQQPGMRLRGALTARLYNTAVTNYADECVRIDDADTDGDDTVDQFSNVTLVNVIGTSCANFYDHEVADSEVGTVGAQSFTLNGLFAINETVANVTPPSMSAVDNGSGFAFDATGYIGAVDPSTTDGNAWWQGWVIDGSTNQ